MRTWLSIVMFLILPCCVSAMEKDSLHMKAKQNDTFNWGAKVGFSSVLPLVHSFTIENEPVESKVVYRVGHMAALFCRINMDRLFIQPSLDWYQTKSEFYFDMPKKVNSLSSPRRLMSDQLKLNIQSVAMPVMIGYNIVKQKPFGLSIMAGANMKYNYKIEYTTNLDNYRDTYTTDDTPFRVNLVGGIGVTLWQIFFDFTYEVGLNQRETNFKRAIDDVPLAGNIVLEKRLNMMGFSLGVLF